MLTDNEVKAMVESWDWNLSCWEIYDVLKFEPEELQSRALTYASKFFNDEYTLKVFADMASFFGVSAGRDSKTKCLKKTK